MCRDTGLASEQQDIAVVAKTATTKLRSNSCVSNMFYSCFLVPIMTIAKSSDICFTESNTVSLDILVSMLTLPSWLLKSRNSLFCR